MLFGVKPIDYLLHDLPRGSFVQIASDDSEDAAMVGLNLLKNAKSPIYINARGLDIDYNIAERIVGDMIVVQDNDVRRVMDILEKSVVSKLGDIIVVDDIPSLVSSAEDESGDEFDTIMQISKRMLFIRRMALKNLVTIVWINRTRSDERGFRVYGRKTIFSKMKATLYAEPRRAISRGWMRVGKEFTLRFIFSPPQFILRKTFIGIIDGEIDEDYWIFKELLRSGAIRRVKEENPESHRIKSYFVYRDNNYTNKWELIEAINNNQDVKTTLLDDILRTYSGGPLAADR